MGQSLRTWLKDKSPDVWFETINHLNWDNSVPFLKWMVSQPTCDKAIAAKIFWLADPAFFACQIASGKGVPSWSESWPLIETILGKWRSGFYERAELEWPDEESRVSISHYWRRVGETAGADKALDIPPELFGALPGRQPRVPPDMTPQENAELWDMLKRQGTFAGPRPGSDQWKAERERAAEVRRPPAFLPRLFGRKPR